MPALLHSYTVGTLRYKFSDLVRVFSWTLSFWFVYSLLTSAYALVIPLVMNADGASNSEILLISVSFAAVMNSILNPVISYASDNTRSRFGRRRPYILWSAPILGFFFALLPFAGDFCRALSAHPQYLRFCGAIGISPLTMTFGLITFGYYLAFGCIGTVPYYMMPDVVPKAVISRYYGLLRIAFAGGSGVFSYFLLQYVQDHGKIIMPAIAVLFVAVTMLAAWRVKEGDYPPPPVRHSNGEPLSLRLWHNIRDYVDGCFGSAYAWLVLITFGLSGISFCVNALMVLFCLEELHMSLAEFGAVNTILAALSLLVLPLSWFLDKANHFRVFFWSWLLTAVFCLAGYLLVFGYWSYLIVSLLITLAGLPTAIDGIKVSIDLFPAGKYGQFCSARAMFNSLCAIVFSYLGGRFFDALQTGCRQHGGGDESWLWIFGHYRALFLWRGIFMLAASLCFWRLYQIWLVKRRAGLVGERRTPVGAE